MVRGSTGLYFWTTFILLSSFLWVSYWKNTVYFHSYAAQVLVGKRNRDHITRILAVLHWLPVNFRIRFKILLFVFKSLNDCALPYLSEILCPYNPTRCLRSADQLFLKGNERFQSVHWDCLPRNHWAFGRHLHSSFKKKNFLNPKWHSMRLSSDACFTALLYSFPFIWWFYGFM